jgi:hypothetical protein
MMATAILGAEDDVDDWVRGALAPPNEAAAEGLLFDFFIRPQYTLPHRQWLFPASSPAIFD